MLCLRVHFKMLIFDFETAYIGSANLTGAGIGMKSSNRRNFSSLRRYAASGLSNFAMSTFGSSTEGRLREGSMGERSKPALC